MGSTVSAGRDNDELVDNLVHGDCITSKLVEKVFRSVDRGEYYLPQSRTEAYEDQAWREKDLHLSAPSIYAKVMEALKLERNLSFLNMGSGTGYLSTMVGLILGSGPNSCNHGVEYHADTIKYAYTKLENFIMTSNSFDEYDFCMPQFFHGNCLNIFTQMKYDRIYCGAECPERDLPIIKGLLKLNGIAIVPIGHYLLEITRTGEEDFALHSFAAVTFAELLPPSPLEEVRLPEVKIASLKALCRSAIRDHIRTSMRRRLGDLTVRPLPRKEDSFARFLQSRRLNSFVARYGELAAAAAIHNRGESGASSNDEEDEHSDNEEAAEVDAELPVAELGPEPMDDSPGLPNTEQINSTSHPDSSQGESQRQQSDSNSMPGSLSHLNSSSSSQTSASSTHYSSTQGSSVSAGAAPDSQATALSGAAENISQGDSAPSAPRPSSPSESSAGSPSSDSPISEAATESGEDNDTEDFSSDGSDDEENGMQQRRRDTSYLRRPRTDDDVERTVNREKANRYHMAFSETMISCVMSLPIPVCLKDYLLYHRNNAQLHLHV